MKFGGKGVEVMTDAEPKLDIHPLTLDCWDDFVDLFGPERGASGGCWCMWWRMPAKEFRATSRIEKRDSFHEIVGAGPPPGILVYSGNLAVGWCAVGPRASLPRLNSSRVAAPIQDDLDAVWAVSCFFLRSGYRGQGLMGTLLGAAAEFARDQGARRVEACPIEPARKLSWGEGFVGIASAFQAAGFKEVARRTPTRPLMALDLA